MTKDSFFLRVVAQLGHEVQKKHTEIPQPLFTSKFLPHIILTIHKFRGTIFYVSAGYIYKLELFFTTFFIFFFSEFIFFFFNRLSDIIRSRKFPSRGGTTKPPPNLVFIKFERVNDFGWIICRLYE